MSAYKKLNKQDAFITTYTAHKEWAMSGSDFSSYKITWDSFVTDKRLQSLQHLYYPVKISGSIVSHSFDYYEQTTLYQPESRILTTGSFLLNIPKELYGTAIKQEEGFKLSVEQLTSDTFLYVAPGYVEEGYFVPYQTDTGRPRGTGQVSVLTIVDDGEGSLYASGSSPRLYVGDIIYPHGIVIITDPRYSAIFANSMNNERLRPKVRLSFKSSQPIFTHNYHCKVREYEYTYTYNPSTLISTVEDVYDNNSEIYNTGSVVNTGDLRSNVTGSDFQPYITTVGLYNDANQLIAVGKLNRPVPKPVNTEMTIIVKIDI